MIRTLYVRWKREEQPGKARCDSRREDRCTGMHRQCHQPVLLDRTLIQRRIGRADIPDPNLAIHAGSNCKQLSQLENGWT